MKFNHGVAVTTGVVLTATALIWAPLAAASPQSDFLDELNAVNATLPGKTARRHGRGGVAVGYATCAHLRSGVSVLDEMSAVEQAYPVQPGHALRQRGDDESMSGLRTLARPQLPTTMQSRTP
jgi:hypothetical protein